LIYKALLENRFNAVYQNKNRQIIYIGSGLFNTYYNGVIKSAF